MKEPSRIEDGSNAKEVIRKEYSPAEEAALAEYRALRKAKLRQMQFKCEKRKDGKHQLNQTGDDPALAIATLAKTTGTVHPDLSKKLLEQIGSASISGKDEKIHAESMNAITAALLDIEPRDGLEGLLAGQMVACHNQSMTLLHNSLNADYLPKMQLLLNSATKLMRTFAAQMETLKKYRSGGQQKVIVEHVHVNKGGQAIVGAVNQGGGGIDEKKSR